MQIEKISIVVAIILETVMGLGYLIYSAVCLVLAVTSSHGWCSILLLTFSLFLFVYALVSFGGFSATLSRIDNTRADKGAPKIG